MDLILVIEQLLSWRALVDIFLVSAGLFFLYRTLQRLGTWGIAAGILIAMVVYLLAGVLDLKGVKWILGNFTHVAVIALIVIFQPELRKIFDQAASVYRSKQQVDLGAEFIGILMDSLWGLASERRGAIVVLPGKESIQEWLSGGYNLDAKPSVPLIMSIFDPNSPGHDGALVIEKSKLARFGVRLPGSQSARLPEEYGTRHRAGMGLAERSDALVIVVSEERGKISVFMNAQMQPMHNREMLSKAISSHLQDTAFFRLDRPEGENRWQMTAQMFGSLLLAFFLWSTLIISQGEMLEKVVTVPVEFTASPAHLVLVGDKDQTIRVHLSGSKSDLDAVNPSEMSAKIDLSKAVSGTQTFVITADNMRLPRNVRLLDVVPSSIELALAEIVSQEISIKPQLLGNLPGTLKIKSMEVIPATVKVLSPAAGKKEKPLNVITTPIYLEGVTKDTSIFCKIIAPPSLQPAGKRWPDVEVVITVGF